MPDSIDWPPSARRIGGVALFLAYVMALIVGVEVVYRQPPSVEGYTGHVAVVTIGAIVASAGLTGAVARIYRLWRMEFLAVTALGCALFIYNVIDWIAALVVFPESPLRGPAIVAFAFWMCVYRGAGLYTFSKRTARVKAYRRRAGRAR